MSDETKTPADNEVESISLFGKPFRPPECCYNCQHMESEHSDIDGKLIFMCCVNLRFPTKKLTCKRQKPNRVIDGKGEL